MARQLQGPKLKCEWCPQVNIHSLLFERHEINPGIWIWVCIPCVRVTGLDEGK